MAAARRAPHSRVADASGAQSPTALTRKIEALWRRSPIDYAGSYLCAIDRRGILKIHTARQDAVGSDLRNVRLAADGTDDPRTFEDILGTDRDWVGRFVALSGQQQIAATSPARNSGLRIMVHVPLNSISKRIFDQEFPWTVGIVVLAIGLFPLSTAMMRWSYLSA